MPACACVLMLASTAGAVDPGPTPDYVHLSWQNDPSTTMTIMWRTMNGVTDQVVQYGPTASYGQSATGTWAALPEGRGYSHTVEITGLAENTTYHYRVGDGGSNWSGDKTFKTAFGADNLCTPFRFIAMGDARSSTGSGASIYWSTVMDAATDENPDFILFGGDMIADGDEQEDGWEDFFDRAEGDLSKFPIMGVWGNHEHHGVSAFLDNFAFPVNDVTGTEDWYDFRVGPIHFFALSTEHGATGYGQQATWMDEKLGDTDAPWTVTFQHRPTYSSGTTHGSEPECQQYFLPVYDAHEIDVNIGSHDHMYERTKPIRNGTPIAGEDYSLGTMYLVSGGAGAFVNPILNIFNNFYLKGIGATHYVIFDVAYNRMRLTVKSEFGLTYDSFEWAKEELGYPTAAFTGPALDIEAGESANFDASDAFDPCDTLADYDWDFGDGLTGSGVTVDHAWDGPGTYTVTLTVTDNDGNTDSAQLDVTVLPATPDDDTTDDDTADDDTTDDDTADDDTADDDVVDDDADDDTWFPDDDSAADDDAATDDDTTDDDAGGGDDDDDGGCCGC